MGEEEDSGILSKMEVADPYNPNFLVAPVGIRREIISQCFFTGFIVSGDTCGDILMVFIAKTFQNFFLLICNGWASQLLLKCLMLLWVSTYNG